MRVAFSLHFLLLVLSVAFFSCTNNDLSGGSTETVNTRVAGLVYMPDGTPADGAVVKIMPSGQDPVSRDTVFYSVKTTSDGSYSFDIPAGTLTGGHYNIIISSQEFSFYSDSLVIEPGFSLEINPAHLNLSGSVSGSVRLQDNGIPTIAYINVIGTDLSTVTTSGNFTINNFPNGKYTVRISAGQSGYDPLDRSITVVSGQADTIKDTIDYSRCCIIDRKL